MNPSDRKAHTARRKLTFPVLFLLLALVVIASIWAGAVHVSPLTLVRSVLHRAGVAGVDPPSAQDLTIVLHIRLPRIVTAFLVGAALSMCGAAMQGLFRNPMASPDILGITAGGSLGAVIAIGTGLYSAGVFVLPVFAMIGAVISSLLIYLISNSGGRTSLLFVVLAGLAISSLFNGLVSAILLFSKQYEVSQFIFWTMGSFDGRMWKHIVVPLPILIPGMVFLLFFARELNMFSLGEENAHSVGMRVEWVKRLVLGVSAIVTGTAIAIGGPVGFVGLLIPHLFRFLIGPDHRVLLPASALGGAAFLILADLIGRVIIPPYEIRVGIVTAVVGSPYFLFLIIRYQRKGFQGS
jgi:iron complex transport system permease protein